MTLPVTKLLVGSGLVIAPVADKAYLPILEQVSNAFSIGLTMRIVAAIWFGLGWCAAHEIDVHARTRR
ncbi:hypothetical protein FJY94_02265 [Candidatus Kaiserbacteria bacterium]|nr:hypothetical protein [Candidatus Kaiserbacteria bacterium]